MHVGIASPLDLEVLGGLIKTPLVERCTTDVPYISQLVKELATKVDSITVFTFSFDVSELTIHQHENISVYICPHRRSARTLGLSFFNIEREMLQKAISLANPDVIHAHWTYEYALGALATKIPTLVTAHDAPWQVAWAFKNIYRTLRLLMALKVSLSSEYMTAVSPYTAMHWRRWMLYRNKYLEVIPNGLPVKSDVEPRKVPISMSEKYLILSVNSGWGQGKNTEALIEAFAEVRKRYPAATLLLVGYGHGINEEAYQWSASRGLSEGIEFLGQVPHERIIEMLERRVDIYVHPSKMEQCCLAILEAMSFAVPVIGGEKSGGVPWQLGYGKYGVTVDISRSSQIAVAILDILGDTARYHDYSTRAYHGFVKDFSLSSVAEKYMALYQKVTAEKNRVGMSRDDGRIY